MSQTLNVIRYISLVTKETVHIALTMAALHDLEIKAAECLCDSMQ